MSADPAFKAKMSAKNQLVVPSAVRTTLGLRAGDEIVFRMTGGRVVVEKAGGSEDPFLHFTEEWQSDADRKAYGDL